MKIVRIIGRIGFVLSMAVYLTTGSIVAAIVSLGLASFNIGFLTGEKSRN